MLGCQGGVQVLSTCLGNLVQVRSPLGVLIVPPRKLGRSSVEFRGRVSDCDMCLTSRNLAWVADKVSPDGQEYITTEYRNAYCLSSLSDVC